MKQTVVITAAIPPVATAILSRQFEVVAYPTESARTEEDMITITAEADGVIAMVTDPITRRVLESNPNLRVVGNYGVGVNNIDLDAARDAGVVVTNTPEALTDGRLAGAGLDAYENEPAVEPRLLALDNVVLLPHLGSATEEARSEMARTVAEDVLAVLSGRPPRYRVV